MRNKILFKFLDCEYAEFDRNGYLDEYSRINEDMFFICNKEHLDPPIECENCKDFKED